MFSRPLTLTCLRAFSAVAHRLSFVAAADELHLTQSAVSRQIKSLEDELGAPLFLRGTRHVQLTADGFALLRVVDPWLARLDSTVQELRRSRRRQRVNVTTFASFASMWLLPRIEAFQRQHPDIDIRISASDALADLGDPDLDLALRYCSQARLPSDATRLFGETLTPVISRALAEQIGRGEAPRLDRPADLARFAWAEEDSGVIDGNPLGWRSWLEAQGEPDLQPRRWIYLDYTYQQVQTALTGTGVALARVPLVLEALQRGELVEPFGAAGRLAVACSYWMLPAPASRGRSEVLAFCAWIDAEAAATRVAIDSVLASR